MHLPRPTGGHHREEWWSLVGTFKRLCVVPLQLSLPQRKIKSFSARACEYLALERQFHGPQILRALRARRGGPALQHRFPQCLREPARQMARVSVAKDFEGRISAIELGVSLSRIPRRSNVQASGGVGPLVRR